MDSHTVTCNFRFQDLTLIVIAIYLYRLVFIHRTDCCGEQFHHIQVHVGYVPSFKKVDKNKLCTRFPGPSATGAVDVLTCDEPVKGGVVLITFYEKFQHPPTITLEEIILLGNRKYYFEED